MASAAYYRIGNLEGSGLLPELQLFIPSPEAFKALRGGREACCGLKPGDSSPRAQDSTCTEPCVAANPLRSQSAARSAHWIKPIRTGMQDSASTEQLAAAARSPYRSLLSSKGAAGASGQASAAEGQTPAVDAQRPLQGDGAVLAGELQNLNIRTQSLPPNSAAATAATSHMGPSSAPVSPSHGDPGQAQAPQRAPPGRGHSRRGSGHSNRSISDTRLKKFHLLLNESSVDLDALRELAWSGIPSELRPCVWQLLLGYLPPNVSRREQTLERKRSEYRDLVPQYFDIANSERSEEELTALNQVLVDVPRTAPGVAFFHQPAIQKSLERILYIWGIRHPASGYVQGINDLVTPFLAVFLSAHFDEDAPMEEWEVTDLTEADIIAVEADAYWSLCKLLDSIQDHYTYAQPGIQRAVFHLKELVRRIDDKAAQHLENEGVEFLQFAFRWVNCLLARELPFQLAVRLWDTYLAEGPRMKEFLIYVLASFVLSWSAELSRMEFQDLMMFLQKLPTSSWSERDIEVVLSRAYMWRASFDEAKSHLHS
ncbi:hypothetical protein WJX74_011120 [Apatococcus lobatus]|uniref:Rab-GAP TBC domain-containing protein n=1 Tax=Apatococcus lobatus TaxID=904363 RepID=A0AAW1QAU2_9CHLO